VKGLADPRGGLRAALPVDYPRKRSARRMVEDIGGRDSKTSMFILKELSQPCFEARELRPEIFSAAPRFVSRLTKEMVGFAAWWEREL